MLKKLSVTGMAVILPLITTAGAITLERVIPVADTVCGGATGGGARYLAIDGSKLYYVATEGMTLVLDLGSFTVRGKFRRSANTRQFRGRTSSSNCLCLGITSCMWQDGTAVCQS